MELTITIIIIAVILLIGLIFWVNSKRQRVSPEDQKRIKTHWNEVIRKKNNDPSGAILDADKLLDETLKLKGFRGSLGEKLKTAESLFSNINSIWAAHKLRNRIAHELNVKIGPKEAEISLRAFKQALKDLGIPLL